MMPRARSILGDRSILTFATPLVLALLASTGSRAAAEEPVPPPPPEEDTALIADLSSPDYAVREAATARLRRSRTLDPESLVAMNAASLPLEARFRLLSACFDTYVTAPLGALGVRQQPPQRGGVGITLQEVIAGFDVARKLRAQDIIHTIDGLPMNDVRDLASAVQRRRPGDVVVIEYQRPQRDGDRIVRDEQNRIVYGPRTNVEVTLGSFQSLPDDEWSGTRSMSEVPVERRNDWIMALARTGSQPRTLALPPEMTDGPNPGDDVDEPLRPRGGRR